MPDNSDSNKRIAKNSVFLSIRMFIVLGITLYTTRKILQILGVEDYGIYNVVCGFVSMFAFLNVSMSNGIQRFFNYEYGRHGKVGANQVYCTAVIIQLVLSVIVIFLAESIGLWYLHNKMVLPVERMYAAEWIFHFSILSFVVGIMQAPFTAAVMAHENLGFYAVVNVIEVILRLGIVILLPYLCYDHLISYGFLMSIISVISLLFYYVYCKRNFDEIKFHYHFYRELFLSMLGFSSWNLFGSLSILMKEQGINLVINFFFGPVVNAARGVASQVNSGVQSFVTNITMPVRPQVIQSYAKGEIARTMHLTYSISKLSCCFLMMMGIPVAFEIDYILDLWLGENVPMHTGTFTIIILLSSMINNLNAATSGVVHATGVMKDYQLWGSLISMTSVPISFFLLEIYSIPEIPLIAVVICSALGHYVCLLVVKRLVGMPLMEYFKEVVSPILLVMLPSLAIIFPIHFYMENGFLRLCMVTIICTLSVISILYAFALNKDERKLFNQVIINIAVKLHIKYLYKS